MFILRSLRLHTSIRFLIRFSPILGRMMIVSIPMSSLQNLSTALDAPTILCSLSLSIRLACCNCTHELFCQSGRNSNSQRIGNELF